MSLVRCALSNQGDRGYPKDDRMGYLRGRQEMGLGVGHISQSVVLESFTQTSRCWLHAGVCWGFLLKDSRTTDFTTTVTIQF